VLLILWEPVWFIVLPLEVDSRAAESFREPLRFVEGCLAPRVLAQVKGELLLEGRIPRAAR